MRRAAVLLSTILIAGCASSPTRWGEHATLFPGLKAIKNAAVRAAVDPVTWTPLIAAGALTATGVDDDWSAEVADHAPLFGGDAEAASSDLRNLTYAAYVVTALAAPSDGANGDWLGNKVRGLETGVLALSLEGLVSEGIKASANRERPDGENERSFPSGHAGQAGAAATLAVANLDYLGLSDGVRGGAAAAFYGLAAASGWGRVECERHYLSDSLFGFALGHYIARFVQEAFFEAGQRDVSVTPVAVDGGFALQFAMPVGGSADR